MLTSDESIQVKLESIKESIVYNKFVVDSLITRSASIEAELNTLQNNVAKLEHNSIRIDERMANIERFAETMRMDIRAIRNAVIGSVLAASILAIGGLAFAGIGNNNRPSMKDSITNPNTIASGISGT